MKKKALCWNLDPLKCFEQNLLFKQTIVDFNRVTFFSCYALTKKGKKMSHIFLCSQTLKRVLMIVLMAVTSSTALAQEFGCNLIKPPIRALEVENHISGSSGEFKRSWETFERVSERGVSPRTLQSVLAELMKTTEKVSRLTDISLLDVEARLRKTEERLVNLLDNGSDVRISRESLVRDVYLRSAAKLSGDRDYLFEMAKWAREEGIRVSSCLTIGRRN